MDYAREKYWQAIDILVGAGSIQTRLTFAAQYLMRLSDKDFADSGLAKRHAEVTAKLTATPLSNHSGYVPRNLTDDEASNLSREILSIYIGLRGGI